MALTAELKNPSYGYLKDGAISFSCTLELKENGVVVSTTGLSTTTNLTPKNQTNTIPVLLPDGITQATDGEGNPLFTSETVLVYDHWVTNIKAQIKMQAEAYIAQYKAMMQIVNAVYPSATVPQDAVEALTTEIASLIVV